MMHGKPKLRIDTPPPPPPPPPEKVQIPERWVVAVWIGVVLLALAFWTAIIALGWWLL